MNFKENKYCVIKNAISKELADFVYDYFLLKREVANTLFNTKYISPFTKLFGYWGDTQIPNTYSHYGDIAMETLLKRVKPIMEEHTGLKLIETYSYARIYKKGDELKRHKDRPSCEISTTLNLGGDAWPIFLEPDATKGKQTDEGYITDNTPGIKIDLNPGDMLVYSGCIFEHWREPFIGENCGQVFLHYNNIETQGENNKYDGRLHLGLPSDLKR